MNLNSQVNYITVAFHFPALQKAGVPREGGPIGVMLTEHETGRQYVRKMREIKKNLSDESTQARSEFAETAGLYIDLQNIYIRGRPFYHAPAYKRLIL